MKTKKFFNTTFPKLGDGISQKDYINKVLTQPLAKRVLDLFLAAPKGVLTAKAVYEAEGLEPIMPPEAERTKPCPYRQVNFSLRRLAHAGLIKNNNKGKHSVYTFDLIAWQTYTRVMIEALVLNN